MFKACVNRSVRLTAKSTLGPWYLSAGRNSCVRFNSSKAPGSDEIKSEIQTQLPSFDQATTATSDAVASLTDQASQVVGDASTHIGYLSSIGLAKSWWWPPELIQNVMEQIHVYSGMPWWGTIVTTTVLVRLLMFPLYVKSSDTMARNSKIKPELDAINAELMASTDMIEGQKVAMKRKKLMADNGVKNRYLAAPILQVPVALGFFSGIRQMANYPVDGFTDQGIAWFSDLTLADPYLGLQIITASVFISFTRLGGETGAQQFSPTMKNFFTIMPLVSIPATMNLASGVVLYFAVNGACSVVQTLLLRNKWFRKKLNIADVVKHAPSTNGPAKGIIDTFRENMQKAREQAERRQLMQENEKKMQEAAKEQKASKTIKIVRRSDFNKRSKK
ncbi:LANO_0F03422g1_1 [Lachancea nothofagi CBS 11611]|uniref:LANO_0F03422g1_1 n=1 Tax=Lachancea nothofagi CBS 11611 TaxID=1266666 RepID=A0A1G4K762_9SACH|nr:LANO_0F03422g1_1 [Lachancea nothofagi CBS 11611]